MFASFKNAKTTRKYRRPQCTLSIEKVEDRVLMTANAYLDFSGATQAELTDACTRIGSCWGDRPTEGRMIGFLEGFTLLDSDDSGYQFMDLDNNSVLNQADGQMAKERVLARVREDFAPYDVNIIEANSPWAVDQMVSNTTFDTLVFVNGTSRFDEPGGQMPRDAGGAAGNTRDEVGAAGDTDTVALWLKNRAIDYAEAQDADDAFVNAMANFISHEIGHGLGLRHLKEVIVDETTGAEGRAPLDDRTLMDPALPFSNVGFTDQEYLDGDGDPQNEHQYLVDKVGPSSKPWVAVLSPR